MTQSTNDQVLCDQLSSLLNGGDAHITFDDFIKDFPAEKCGERVEDLPYTAWQVLEHMSIDLWDILEFSRDANHVSHKWPEGYWPHKNEVSDASAWIESDGKFHNYLNVMSKL